MPPFKLIVLLAAVTVVAACGPDPAPGEEASGAAPGPAVAAADPAPETVADPPLDDEEVVRLVFVAAADGDLSALPERLTPRVSAVRVGVVALHDQLLERRAPTPGRAAVLDALRELATRPGGFDTAALGGMVNTWSGWTDAQAATETELARLLSFASAGFALPQLPRAEGLGDLAAKAAEHAPPPPGSAAGAGIEFVRYAARALGDEPGNADALLREAGAAFSELGWPGGLALLAEPVANRLLGQDPTSVTGSVLWSTAVDAYRKSGDLLRSGMMYVDRARLAWRGEADPETARRAALLAETGRSRVEESGAGGRELFEACSVHAFALQASGRHEDAVSAADAALAVPDVGDAEDRASLDRVRGVSLFRLDRFDEALAAAQSGVARLDVDGVREREAGKAGIPALRELAAQALYRLKRYDEAAELLAQIAAFYGREVDKPWGSEEQRDGALMVRAKVLADKGDAAAARAAVREVLASGGKGAQILALGADVLLEAGFVDDADQIIAQAEEALGPERSAAFGELRARVAVARGDMVAARTAFRRAIDYTTGGDPTRQSLSASRIFERWARSEEAAGERERAAEHFQTAANHLVGLGMEREVQRLLAEVERLR